MTDPEKAMDLWRENFPPPVLGSGEAVGVWDEIVERALAVFIVAMQKTGTTREGLRAALEAVWPEPLFTEEEREVAHWAVELALSEVGHSRIAAGAVLRSARAKLERS
jgi:hypothetical protein